MTLRLGLIGMSAGNGHPYSWAAICNSYDQLLIQNCGYPSIPEYLAKRSWPSDRLSGVEVTHVWTQDIEESHKIAKSTFIKHVVKRPTDMIGNIDALLLARDDARNHLYFAEPFLRLGLPVYIDKPIALSIADLTSLLQLQRYKGQIFSCSALRYASEIRLSRSELNKIGDLKLIQATSPKYWTTYAIHLIDPIVCLLGHEKVPQILEAKSLLHDGYFVKARWPDGGPVVEFTLTGKISSNISFTFVGDQGSITKTFNDSFTAFKRALEYFRDGIAVPDIQLQKYYKRAVQLLERGGL